VKTKDLVQSISNKFTVALKERLKSIDVEAEKSKTINEDKLVLIYANLKVMYPEFIEEFENRKNARIREITPSYKTSTTYYDERTIKDKVIEFTLNNEFYTFDQIYNYCVAGLDIKYLNLK